MRNDTPARLYGAYVFDLDGTIVLGDELLPTAAETVVRLRELGCRTLFLTNNPTSKPARYADSLAALGLPVDPTDVVTSALVLIDHLRRVSSTARLMVIGEAALIEMLEEAGFPVVDDPTCTDVLIASFDRTFSYAKLQAGFDALRAGARFIATNGDRYRPTFKGGEPDAAAVIAAFEACSGCRCETIVGKPSRLTSRYLLERLALPSSDCLIVGDRLETDVAMGLEAGIDAALVFTGATSRSAAATSAIIPTYLLDRLSELLPVGL